MVPPVSVNPQGGGHPSYQEADVDRAANDPDYKIAELFETMSREDVYEEAVRIEAVLKMKSMKYEYDIVKDESNKNGARFYRWAAFLGADTPMGLHTGAFIPTIMAQATEQQQAHWLPKCETMEMIGTYVQTELGHGTFLRGLETRATYDKERQEFILHSPTLTSTKYWPGGLGRTANHAIVMAQLEIEGKRYGMHAFMVQLRRTTDHTVLPGIEIGDINFKFGFAANDNGYLRFNKYRIPRTNMLMKYTQVSPAGVYARQSLPQLSYLSMVLLRSGMVTGAANELAIACTIATRYSAVRHQTANSKDVEPQILDYQTQQMKLFPAIACAYALFFAGRQVRQTYLDVTQAVSEGDISRMAELHNMTAGLKALSTEMCCEHIEIVRRACGGHGYSRASGFPKIFARCVPACTYEGENTVLYLQSARSLMKFFGKAQAGAPLPQSLQFLGDKLEIPSELRKATSFNMKLYCEAYRLNALASVTAAALAMQSSKYSGSDDSDKIWNDHSYQLTGVAKAYALFFTADMFVKSLSDPSWDRQALAVMTNVCELFLVHYILENSGHYMQHTILSNHQIGLLQARRSELLKPLRVNAVALVDAFDYPDRMLNSCLGRYDGNVYEALMEYAKSSNLNKSEVHPSFYKYIKPMQQSLQHQSKL